MSHREIISGASRLVLGAVFVIAGISKIWSPQSAVSFAAYWLPDQLDSISMFFTLSVANLEFAIGLLMIIGMGLKKNLAVGFGLLCVFTLLLVLSQMRGDAPSCGCFGAAGSDLFDSSPWAAVLRNLALLGMCVVAARSSSVDVRQQAVESEHATM